MDNGLNRRKIRKIFLLFAVIFMTAIVLIIETYAWFVGITTVNVSAFDVSVTAAQGLELSLNGVTWVSGNTPLQITSTSGSPPTTTINITQTNCDTSSSANCPYANNTNKWPTNGLKPVSSAGVLDTTVSRLMFYDKSSLSATEGGYRLIANRVDNHTETNNVLVSEADGYIAFDLFIRNGVENSYVNSLDENIYLTPNSSVTLSGGTPTGAANSVRVGFFQIGVMNSSGSIGTLQSTNCQTTGNICSSSRADPNVKWSVWEPNDTVHDAGVVSYFDNICRKRTSDTVYDTSQHCNALTSTYRNTYYVLDAISANDNVDIYDGADLNGYTLTTDGVTDSNDKLATINTYKTPANGNSYTYENQLLKLAGNSITKVRVYIWLEGQDVDNYDLVAANSLSMSFGFTKDRFNIGASPSSSGS